MPCLRRWCATGRSLRPLLQQRELDLPAAGRLQSSGRSPEKNHGFSHRHFDGPALKRETKSGSSLWSAEALLPRMNARAPTERRKTKREKQKPRCVSTGAFCLRRDLRCESNLGAVEWIRTTTVLLPPAPQAGASASSATTARVNVAHLFRGEALVRDSDYRRVSLRRQYPPFVFT